MHTATLSCVQQRVATVLSRMLDMAKSDEDDAQMFADVLEPMLNDLHGQDAFGTEGQCDPRGDFRNGQWSMDRVEDVGSEERSLSSGLHGAIMNLVGTPPTNAQGEVLLAYKIGHRDARHAAAELVCAAGLD